MTHFTTLQVPIILTSKEKDTNHDFNKLDVMALNTMIIKSQWFSLQFHSQPAKLSIVYSNEFWAKPFQQQVVCEFPKILLYGIIECRPLPHGKWNFSFLTISTQSNSIYSKHVVIVRREKKWDMVGANDTY